MNTKKELKKSIVFVVLAVSLLFLAVPMASASDFSYRKAIEIDHTKVAGDLTNFPVLISITDDDLRDDAQDTGNDIMFTDSSLNPLAHEIEYFNGTTGELQAWVKVTSLSSASTTIYMYYGNATCESQENVVDVWDSHFKMVQHLNETTGMHYDSTANGNDGTPEGELTQDIIGKIGGADGFGGRYSGDVVNCGNKPSLDIPGNITIEAWAKPDSFGYWGEIVSKRDDKQTQSANYDLRFGNLGTSALYNKIQFYWRNGIWQVYTTNSTYTTGAWYHIVATREGTDLPKIYVNGVLAGGTCTFGNCNNAMLADTNDLNLGAGIDSNGNYNWIFNGTIDEVRISDTARSAAWINTSYNNQNDRSSFITVGDEQTTDPGIPEFPTMSLPVLITIAAVFLMYRRKQRQ